MMKTTGATGKKIAIFISSFGDGGVEHMLVNLANGFYGRGLIVSLIVTEKSADFIHRLNPNVELLHLASDKSDVLAHELAEYVKKEHPDILLAGKEEDFEIVYKAKILLDKPYHTRFFIMVGGVASTLWRLRRKNPITTWLYRRKMKKVLNGVDGVIANAKAVAEDLEVFAWVKPEHIQVAPNPTITEDVAARLTIHAEHPWFAKGEPPVIMGIGRLAGVKDFPTLIRAFALLREKWPCRLMILGRGRQEEKLAKLIGSLGLTEDVVLTGFVDNPFAYLSQAALFVLSSLSEGSPNVLIEALAAGVPVVSTDCSGGVHEILQEGRYGRIVPMGDPQALAEAMSETLAKPLPAEYLRQACEPFTMDNSCIAHLLAFGFDI